MREALRGLYGIAGPMGPGAAVDDAEQRRRDTLAVAEALLSGGAPVVQLRDKFSNGRALLTTAHLLRRLTREAGALFVVNDRLDVALLSDADGIHVGQDDLPVDAVRRVAGRTGRDNLLIGLSTHDLDQVRSAVALGVDYVGFGPVFATLTKIGDTPPRGVDLLARAVAAAAGVPVVAIGGITLETARAVAAAGAAMAAVIGDVAGAPDRAGRVRELHAALSRR